MFQQITQMRVYHLPVAMERVSPLVMEHIDVFVQ